MAGITYNTPEHWELRRLQQSYGVNSIEKVLEIAIHYERLAKICSSGPEKREHGHRAKEYFRYAELMELLGE